VIYQTSLAYLQQAAAASQHGLLGQQFTLLATPAYTVTETAAAASKMIKAIFVFIILLI
jgi:hypothetical protein